MSSVCRICQSLEVEVYVDFGSLAMTGFFPSAGEEVPRAPLALGKCRTCGLVQLRDKIPIKELYGANYGYESHINSSMKTHLINTAQFLQSFQLKVRSSSVILRLEYILNEDPIDLNKNRPP